MTEKTTIIGRRLAETRKDRGISQREIAKRLEVSRTRVQVIERSEDLLLSTLIRYLGALGFKADKIAELFK